MKPWHQVDLQDVPPSPWRNRGGATRELLAWPDATDWSVRVSVARIDRSGPFSAFAGVERWFTVLSGAGVRLRFAGAVRELRSGDAPCRFDGAEAPQAELLDGPTDDLNFMVRSAFGRALMTPVAECAQLGAGGHWRGLFAADALVLCIDDEKIPVPAGSLVWSDAAAVQRWSVDDAGSVRAWFLAVAL